MFQRSMIRTRIQRGFISVLSSDFDPPHVNQGLFLREYLYSAEAGRCTSDSIAGNHLGYVSSSSDRASFPLPNRRRRFFTKPSGCRTCGGIHLCLEAAARDISDGQRFPHSGSGTGQNSLRIVRFFHMLRSLSAQLFWRPTVRLHRNRADRRRYNDITSAKRVFGVALELHQSNHVVVRTLGSRCRKE